MKIHNKILKIPYIHKNICKDTLENILYKHQEKPGYMRTTGAINSANL